jgi:hypothetical protein
VSGRTRPNKKEACFSSRPRGKTAQIKHQLFTDGAARRGSSLLKVVRQPGWDVDGRTGGSTDASLSK